MVSTGDGGASRGVFEASPEPIFVHHPETGAVTDANPAAADLVGVDRTDLVGTEVGAFSPDSYTSPEANDRIRAAASEGSASVEWRIETPDGGSKWVDVALERATHDGDRRVLAFVRDVTARRDRERGYRERTAQLRTLVENLPVVVFTLDPEGVFTHSSGRGLAFLGLEQGELEGVSVFDAYEGYDDIVDAADRALDGEEVRVTQDVDDLVFETWYRPVFDDGDLAQVVGVARDVTDLVRREERVRRLGEASQRLLYAGSAPEVADTVTEIAQSIVGRPLAALWTYDEGDDTLYPAGATTQATAFGGADEPTALPPMGPGTDEKAIFDAGDPAVIEDYQDLENPSAPGVPLRTMLYLPLADHGMLCIGSPEVEAFDGTERHLLDILASTATAALDRVERERDLRAYREELERSNEALQQFAYVASHDLQEPLRMVSSYVDLLEMEYGDQFDAEAREYMDFAVDGAERMQAMIDGLLAYSRVETSAGSFEPVDATAVLGDTLDELALLLDEHGATVESDDLPTVAADRAQLGQLFQNLLKNAVEHGGADTVSVEATVDSETVEFAVADDGVGIPDDQHERIFEIFEQGQAGADGTGMGLAICERIVARHDGDIRVESEPGDGATFYVTLPRSNEDDR